MNKYILSCCSTADLSKEHFNNRNINIINFHYYINGKEYVDDLGQTMDFKEFYQLMRDGAETKTSQVNVEEYLIYFKSFLDKGLDILHISISYGVSGSYNSAMLAKSILEEEYPNRKIIVINSKGASSGYGLLVDKIADLRDEGLALDDLAKWAEDNKLNLQHWFYTTDLSYFVKGGRISKTSGFVGGLLNVNPLLTIDTEGKLTPKYKVIGKKRVQKKLLDLMINNASNGLGYNDQVYISHSDCFDDALSIANMIEDTFKQLKGKVLINNIGTTVGSHTGPGTIALFYWGNNRDA